MLHSTFYTPVLYSNGLQPHCTVTVSTTRAAVLSFTIVYTQLQTVRAQFSSLAPCVVLCKVSVKHRPISAVAYHSYLV